MIPIETLDRLLEVGASNTEVFHAHEEGVPLALVPKSMDVRDLSAFVPPTHIKRHVKLYDADSFAEYVNRFKTDETLLFANARTDGVSFKAILDYHGAAPDLVAAYCDHVAEFATVQTPEWQTWLDSDRDPKSQLEFATWLEDNQQLLKDPSGASLLELICTLEGKNEVRFSSAQRLKSGANKLVYDEDVMLQGQPGTQGGFVELPATITAGIKPFEGSLPYEVNARLKYRIEGRRLSLWYETIALHVIIRDNIKLLFDAIAAKTKITPLLGHT